RRFDCMVVDLELLGLDDFELLERLGQRQPDDRAMAIVIYGADPPSEAQTREIRRLAERLPIRLVRTPEHLFGETARLLHRAFDRLPEPKRELLRRLARTDTALVGRKVMVVDDDVRNIFAITAIL